MSNFIIKGKSCDEATAELKAKLEANDAHFNAQLDALFKPAGQQQSAPAPAGPSQETSGWANSTGRKRPGKGSMHSRLRG